jgi:hypothetical protein
VALKQEAASIWHGESSTCRMACQHYGHNAHVSLEMMYCHCWVRKAHSRKLFGSWWCTSPEV